jgi:hypothetical protein
MKRLTLAACFLVFCATSMAEPGYYLVTVYGNTGEKSIDYRDWTVKFPHQTETSWALAMVSPHAGIPRFLPAT